MQFSIGDRNVGPKYYLPGYVILKGQNRRLILHENLVFLDMMEPYISSIQWYQCGSNICNINGNIVQNIGPTSLEYFPHCPHPYPLHHNAYTLSQYSNSLYSLHDVLGLVNGVSSRLGEFRQHVVRIILPLPIQAVSTTKSYVQSSLHSLTATSGYVILIFTIIHPLLTLGL